ncbi:hypothetical protein Vafri_2750, partial [Volvox africanus]
HWSRYWFDTGQIQAGEGGQRRGQAGDGGGAIRVAEAAGLNAATGSLDCEDRAVYGQVLQAGEGRQSGGKSERSAAMYTNSERSTWALPRRERLRRDVNCGPRRTPPHIDTHDRGSLPTCSATVNGSPPTQLTAWEIRPLSGGLSSSLARARQKDSGLGSS